MSTRVEKQAVAKFNHLRRDLEKEFPTRELTPEQKRAVLEKDLLDTNERASLPG
ncbi:MAG: hypothetical protein ACRD9S_05640 [Pyrinomonadaceae bacterium]